MTAANSHPDRRAFILLMLLVLAIEVLSMPRQLCPGDPSAWTAEARSLFLTGHLSIDPSVVVSLGMPGQYFVANYSDGHWYSKYGIVNSLMSLPPLIAQHAIDGNVDMPDVRILNVWSALLGLLLAAAIFNITGRYTNSHWRRSTFVLACLFTTNLWYYQRAQGQGELYQTLFFTLFFTSLLRAMEEPRGPSAKWLLAAWLWAGLLVLTRIFFGILIPIMVIVCCVTILRRRQSLSRSLPALLIPPMVILAILGAINNVKFGSPWQTGYEQWRPKEHLPTGSILDGLVGMFTSSHWNLFIYFPVLLVALPRWKAFWKSHTTDAAILTAILVVTLITLGKTPSWRGEWSYGPRYMLFLLPMLSLPALGFAKDTVGIGRRLALAAAACGLAFSFWLQLEVNTSEFWCWYQIQDPLQNKMDRDVAEYFYDHPEGVVLHDLSSHRNDLDDTMLFRRLKDRFTAAELENYRNLVQAHLAPVNLFWFSRHQG
jgi:hypothetical protein